MTATVASVIDVVASSEDGWSVKVGGKGYEVVRQMGGLLFYPHFGAGVAHTVQFDSTGTPWECSCPDRHYRRRRCKHLRVAAKVLNQEQ